jgi:hypothetical protein
MTVYVLRDGELVEKRAAGPLRGGPYISRLEPYRSPIDGKEITSWRQRDRDLKDSNSYDPRDGRHERPEPRQFELFAPRE